VLEQIVNKTYYGNPLYEVAKRPIGGGSYAVYVISCLPHGVCKIGHARDTTQRLCNLQGGCWEELTLEDAYWLNDKGAAMRVEFATHKALKAKHARGEWFYCKPWEGSQAIQMVLRKVGFDMSRYMDFAEADLLDELEGLDIKSELT
jgi:hypothetical protein